jgi:TPR repeat protein
MAATDARPQLRRPRRRRRRRRRPRHPTPLLWLRLRRRSLPPSAPTTPVGSAVSTPTKAGGRDERLAEFDVGFSNRADKVLQEGLAEARRLLAAGREAEAAQRLRRLAQAGLAEAQVAWGDCLLQGTGVQGNPSAAVQQFRAAARQKSAAAMLRLGRCTQLGIGVALPSAARALSLFEEAAALGSHEAHMELGDAYAAGNGVSRDLRRALTHYRHAAQADSRAVGLAQRISAELAKSEAAAADGRGGKRQPSSPPADALARVKRARLGAAKR